MFSVFTFPLLQGELKTALVRPNTVVISQSMAQKYFGDEDPIGQQLTYVNQATVFDLQVTGIMKDTPQTSHFHPEFLGSLSTYKPGTWHHTYNLPISWTNHFYRSYILLSENADYHDVEARLPAFLYKHAGEETESFNPFLQPIEDIHLHSNFISEFELNSDISYVYIFGTVAFLILLIASINYMNLSTARATRRAKEVGLRKTVGGNRFQLIQQFYVEAFILALLSFLVSLSIANITLPWINQLSGKELSLSVFASVEGILLGSGFLFLITLFSGSYPALLLSGIQPAAVFKNISFGKANRIGLRSVLVVTQFATTAFLIIAAIVVSEQLQFFNSVRPATNKDVVLTTPLRDTEVAQKYQSFKNILLQDSRVQGVTVSSHVPFTANKTANYFFPEILGNDTEFISDYFVVGSDFLSLFNIKLKNGRDFVPMREDAGKIRQFIVNETAVKALGLTNDEIIGKHIKDPFWEVSGQVIGVVEDFHYKRMHENIGPLVIKMDPDYVRFLTVRIQAGPLAEQIDFLSEKWQSIFPTSPFSFTFMDDNLNKMYQAEEKMGAILNLFGIAAIFISCIGLFGLAALATEQRTKEIGIRKVLGASSPEILKLVSREFLFMILVANVVAWPAAWYILNIWLQNFANRIEIGLTPMLLSAAVVTLVGLLTVSWQSIRASMANPVESLRYE